VVEGVTGPLRPRTGLGVAGGRAVDDPRVAALDVVVADAEPSDDAGPEALDDDVSMLGEAQERLPSRGGLQVELDPAGAAAAGVGVLRWRDLHAGAAG